MNPAVAAARVAAKGCAGSMKDLLWDEFQEHVQEGLVRHRSILDVLSKFQEASVRVGRAIVKAVTTCGCVRIKAQKHELPPDISLQEVRSYMDDHLEGELCPQCREVVEEEIGRVLFYMAAMANLFDLNVYDVLIKENKKVSALGLYHMS
jgi:hypothetical protein